jgi:DNA (cytosine-5)-methyltransferase 1
MTFQMGELFCGPGGIAKGVDLANQAMAAQGIRVQHAWATDYHPETCETYRLNIFPQNPEKVVCADIRTLDYSELRKLGEVDGLSFGFPCNDFSIVGEQKGTDGEFGPLYTYAVKGLREFQPQWFLAENVSGLSSSNNGRAFESILREFKACGYRLYPHHYKFEDYGIPQNRHRIIIIGIRNDVNVEFGVPKPTGQTKTASQALAGIPANAANQEATRMSDTVVERLTHIRPGENAFNAHLPERQAAA